MIWGHFWKKYRKLFGYIALFLLPIGALYIDEIRFPKTLILQNINSYIVHPISESISSTVSGIVYISQNYVALRNVKAQNEELAKANAQLKLELLQLQEMGLENKRLFALLSLKKDRSQKGIIAHIIGEDATSDRFTYLINAGVKDGIQPYSPVLNSDGIVGLIKEVYAHSSILVTLLDPSSTIDAVSVRSRSHAFIEGTGREYLARTKFVDRIEDFKVGDMLLSSGLDGLFPKGFPIGTIVEVKKPALGVLQTSYLRPSVEYDKLEEVLVLPPLKQDLSRKEPVR
jgi:rod shape-determining protein MreC